MMPMTTNVKIGLGALHQHEKAQGDVSKRNAHAAWAVYQHRTRQEAIVEDNTDNEPRLEVWVAQTVKTGQKDARRVRQAGRPTGCCYSPHPTARTGRTKEPNRSMSRRRSRERDDLLMWSGTE